MNSLDRKTVIGLRAIACASVAGAAAHAIWPDAVDEESAKFLALAAAALVLPQVDKFEFFGIKAEKIRDEVQKEVQKEIQPISRQMNEYNDLGLSKLAEFLDDDAELPGRPRPGTTHSAQLAVPDRSAHAELLATQEDEWNSDPNAGQFGGTPERNGRLLSAEIFPTASAKSAACRIVLRVTSTDPARPLTGKVKFHLHPTFGRWKQYDVDVKEGVAEDEITSWGVFTVGATADDGNTKLELNLAKVKGGTEKFYDF